MRGFVNLKLILTYMVSSTDKSNNFKETVSVISSDPQCIELNARFTTVPLKPLSGEERTRDVHFYVS